MAAIRARLRRRRRAYAPTSNTASYDIHEKINPWASFSFIYKYEAPSQQPFEPRGLNKSARSSVKSASVTKQIAHFVSLEMHCFRTRKAKTESSKLIELHVSCKYSSLCVSFTVAVCFCSIYFLDRFGLFNYGYFQINNDINSIKLKLKFCTEPK